MKKITYQSPLLTVMKSCNGLLCSAGSRAVRTVAECKVGTNITTIGCSAGSVATKTEESCGTGTIAANTSANLDLTACSDGITASAANINKACSSGTNKYDKGCLVGANPS